MVSPDGKSNRKLTQRVFTIFGFSKDGSQVLGIFSNRDAKGQRQLFSIGYNLPAGKLDSSHYDLLASEACLGSFLAVARAHREHSQEQLNMPAPVPEPAAVSPWAIVTDDLPGLNGHNPEPS